MRKTVLVAAIVIASTPAACSSQHGSAAGPPVAQYKGCTASDVRASFDSSGAALGNISTRIRLTNVGDAPCTFTGYPTSLVGVRANGRTQVLHPTHGTMFDDSSAWVANLRVGQSALMSIATGDACPALNRRHPSQRGRRKSFVGEIVGLPGGGTVAATGPFNAACGVGVSKIGQPARPAPDPHASSL